MPLQNYQFDIIMREYNRRQSESRRTLEEHREEIYRLLPRIREIDGEVASLCAARARARLNRMRAPGTISVGSGTAGSIGSPSSSNAAGTTAIRPGSSAAESASGLSASDTLRQEVAALSEERQVLLLSHGYPANYLEEVHTCPHCQDTGYINGEKCTCFRQMEVELLYTQSNLNEILEKENFRHFSFDCYSDRIVDENTGLSALEAARRAYAHAQSFVKNFDTAQENLFFYGNTGVGKTFLSHCIAKALLDSAHFVLYFSAYDLFDLMARNTFSRSHETEEQEQYIFDCDLLIIDDLGTEITNSFVSSQLFLCINERLMRHKSTIISTNLKLEDFSAMYSERTFSRIASNYRMIKLLGNDIRLRKLF